MTIENVSIGAVKRAPKQRRPFRRLWLRVRRPIVNRILHLDDSPHRIALGVFLGFVVGWTPTMGAQIVLYLIIAYLLRANRASGVLPVLLTNPLTALPVYVFNWRIGRWIMHPGGLSEADRLAQREAMDQFLNNFHVSRLFDGDFWASVGPTFQIFGLELIVGCLIVGFACGLAGYVATYYGIIVYRRRRSHRAAMAEKAIENANKEMAVQP